MGDDVGAVTQSPDEDPGKAELRAAGTPMHASVDGAFQQDLVCWLFLCSGARRRRLQANASVTCLGETLGGCWEATFAWGAAPLVLVRWVIGDGALDIRTSTAPRRREDGRKAKKDEYCTHYGRKVKKDEYCTQKEGRRK
eukprot:gene4695-8715_t